MKKYPKQEWEHCPFCPDRGWYMVGNEETGFEQERCQWCWENEKSYFNQEQLKAHDPETNI